MILREIAGLHPLPEDAPRELHTRHAALLTAHAAYFLAAGGTLSLSDWAALDAGERAALAAAGRAQLVEQALRVGRASRGELEALKVQAEVDEGRAHDEALLRNAVATLAAAVGGRRAPSA